MRRTPVSCSFFQHVKCEIVNWKLPYQTYRTGTFFAREKESSEKEKKDMEEREVRNDEQSWKLGSGGGWRESSRYSCCEANEDSQRGG